MTVNVDSHGDRAVIIRQIHDADPAGNLFFALVNSASTIIGTIRLGLADPPDKTVTVRAVAKAAWELNEPQWDQAASLILAAFGPADIADPYLDLTVKTLAMTSPAITLVDVLRVDQGRCWSWLCPHAGHNQDGPGVPVDLTSDAAIQTVIELAAIPPSPEVPI
jgi:hypothetical protein